MIHGIDTSFLVAVELVSHSRHAESRQLTERLIKHGDQFALAPQILTEFIHIVTDGRRCANPLDMDTALDRTESLWNAAETVQMFPNVAATARFLVWMRQYKLGRKRLLDTMVAATLNAAGVQSLVTLNRRDFEIFGCFTIHEP